MINCIDCENLIKWIRRRKGKEIEEIYEKCDYANENVKECMYFKNAHRKILAMDYQKEVKEMLEDD